MFFRRRTFSDDDDSDDSSISSESTMSSCGSSTDGTSYFSPSTMDETLVTTVTSPNGTGACMRIGEMMFFSGDEEAGYDGWGPRSTGSGTVLSSVASSEKKWTRRFYKHQVQEKIPPNASLSFESLVSSAVAKEAGCMGFHWPSSSEDEEDDDGEETKDEDDTFLSSTLSGLSPVSDTTGMAKVIESHRIKSKNRKKYNSSAARQLQQQLPNGEDSRMQRPLSPVWQALTKSLSGGTTSDGNEGKGAGIGIAAAAAGTAALGAAAAAGAASGGDHEQKSSSKKLQSMMSRSTSDSQVTSNDGKRKFRRFWKKGSNVGYLSDDADLIPSDTVTTQKLANPRRDAQPIVPTATTISRSIRYLPPGHRTRRSSTSKKSQTPRQLKLNQAVIVYGADARQDNGDQVRATSGKYVPSATLERQISCADGRILAPNSPTQLNVRPKGSGRSDTIGKYQLNRQAGNRSEHHPAAMTRKNVSRYDGQGATRDGRSSQRDYASDVKIRRSSSVKSVRTSKSTSSRRTNGDRSTGTRKSSKSRRSTFNDDVDVLGFLSPPSMEA